MKPVKILKVAMVIILLHSHLVANAQSETAMKYAKEGETYFNQNKNDLAIGSFTEAIKIDPNYFNAYWARGYLYFLKNEYDIAIKDFKESIRIDPKSATAHHYLAMTYEYKVNVDMAIKEYKEAIRLDTAKQISYFAHLYLGNNYLTKKDYESALDNYNEAIRIDPKIIGGYEARAKLYQAKKEYENVINECYRILKIDEKSALAYEIMAKVYYLQGMTDEAIEAISGAIKFDLKNANYYVLRGDYYEKKRENELMVKDYTEAIRLDNSPKTLRKRADFYLAQKKYELALQDYNQAIKFGPKDIYNYDSRARFYRRTGQYDLALADYAKIFQLNPNPKNIINGRALIHKLNGNYELVIADIERALVLDSWFQPLTSLNYFFIIPPLVRTGQLAKAKEYANKYIAYGSTSVNKNIVLINNYYLSVITTNLPNGQYAVALTNLDKALQVFPNMRTIDEDDFNKSLYIDVLALKGQVLEKLGKYNEAKEVFEQCLAINKNQPDVVTAINKLTQKQSIVNVQDKTIPSIELISPENSRGLKIVKNESNIEIVGKAKDESGIKSVSINGVAVTKLEDDGLFLTKITLKEGLNKITIKAIDKNNNTANKTFEINTSVQSTVIKNQENEIIPVIADKPPVFYAILIGENEYQDPSIDDLSNPAKDALALKTILKTKYTFEEKNIETLLNKSREEIMQAIVLKSNTLKENDNLVIFYAGHGIAEKDKFGDVDGYWIPSSAKKGMTSTYISADDINKAIKRSESKHILIIADACFSGAFTRLMSTDAPKDIQTQYKYNSRKIMASGNMEPVPDNSKFIYYLNKNLQDNKLKYLTAKDLFNSFYKAVINNTDTLPQYAAIKNVGDEGGEFVFILR